MDTWKLLLLLLCLSGFCCAGPLGAKRNMPIVPRDDQPMIRQPADPEEDQPAEEPAPPELLSTLTLPSNATSIRADITDNFSCENKTYGYYADVENECQIFHVCLPVTYADGKENTFRWSFICPEETVFSQESFTCMRPDDMNFDCEESLKYYELNSNFGAVEEETNINTNNKKPMTVSKEPQTQSAMIAQSEVEQSAAEEPMEMAAAPPKPTLTQPMKESKKPNKAPVPNRRKPGQTQTGFMTKPVPIQPLRKLPQVVPNIEPAPATAIVAKPAEEEEKPIYQKYHKRPITVQTTSFKDKLQAQKPVKVTPIRAEMYNQVRKRPTYFNKKDTPTPEVEEMSQPELAEPVPTLKLETIFMPAQKPEFVAETETNTAELSPDNTAQASVAEEIYVRPEEDIDTAVKIAEKYEENEVLMPEVTETAAENLATVEGVLKTEEPESVEENITSVESLKSSVYTAESANVAETAVDTENVVEPQDEVSETEPVIKFAIPNEAVTNTEVQQEEKDKPVMTNAAENVGDEETTDEEEQQAVKFTLENEDKVPEEEETPEIKLTLPNQVEDIKEEPETLIPAEEDKLAVKYGSSDQVQKLTAEPEEEEEEKENTVVEFTLASQGEETKEALTTSEKEKVESEAVKFESQKPVENIETQPEEQKIQAVKFVLSGPTETETQPEEEETPTVYFESSNPTESETQPEISEPEEEETSAEKSETQPETSEPEKEETPAVKFEKPDTEEETVAAQNTQEAEPIAPEHPESMAVKFVEPEIKPETPTDFDDNSQQSIEAIEEIPAIISEAEQTKPVMTEQENTVDEGNAIKTLKEDPDSNQESAEALATPSETSPADVISSTLEEMEDAKPANAVEIMEATPAMQEHDPIVQTMFANTLKQSSGGFKPVDPAMAAEAEALITDFLSTLMKSESSNNKPIYPGEAEAEAEVLETKAEENMTEDSAASLEEETQKNTENDAKLESAPEIDEADSQMLKNGAPMSSMLMFNQLPETMYQIPVQVINSPENGEKYTPEIEEKDQETHKNLDALHVKNAHEEASQAETEQIQPEQFATSAEEEDVAPNATPDLEQSKTAVDSIAAYTPLSIDDIVELVKERLEQKPSRAQVNWAESADPLIVEELSESEPIVAKLESLDEEKPYEPQPNEEIIMPIYQRVIDAVPNMLKSHHHLLVNEPTAIITESKPATVQFKPEEPLEEVSVVDIKQAIDIPEEPLIVASEPQTVAAQQEAAPETAEVPEPSPEFVVDPKTGRFYRSRSLRNTKMDPRKRRFLFRSDAS